MSIESPFLWRFLYPWQRTKKKPKKLSLMLRCWERKGSLIDLFWDARWASSKRAYVYWFAEAGVVRRYLPSYSRERRSRYLNRTVLLFFTRGQAPRPLESNVARKTQRLHDPQFHDPSPIVANNNTKSKSPEHGTIWFSSINLSSISKARCSR